MPVRLRHAASVPLTRLTKRVPSDLSPALCEMRSAAAVDGEGCTALHACCIDLNVAAERAEAGLDCNPATVVALLLTRGCPALAASNGGMTALAHCKAHKGRHAAAAACADILEQWVDSKVLESTRL